ncbi:MAG: hypothetical protein K8J31_02935 [Anaerolineae bacterium]|nr:hypothetical protein [Anaerolineae bacterium]
MSDVDVILSLPEKLVERARARGVLSNERVAQLLEVEIERMERWQSLDQSLEPVREAFRGDHADMTEDEIMAMINEAVHEVRAERKTPHDHGTDEGSAG